jgi:hypothetical protein
MRESFKSCALCQYILQIRATQTYARVLKTNQLLARVFKAWRMVPKPPAGLRA